MSLLPFLLLIAGVLFVAGAMHAFLYRGLVRGFDIRSLRVRWGLRVLLGVLAVSYPVARLLGAHAPPRVAEVAYTVACLWIGVMFNLLWIGIDVWVLGFLLRLVGLRQRLHERTLRRGAVMLTIAAAVTVSLLGYRSAHGPARVREARVPVKFLTPDIGNLTIAMAADLHAGALMDLGEVEKRVAEVMALNPDLILLPGDILDHPPERMPEIAAALARLKAPSGVFASTGNHEYIVGVEASVALLESAGIRVLQNERVLVGPGLIVSGVNDRSATRFGGTVAPAAQVLEVAGIRLPVIHLNHTPSLDVSRETIEAGADLILSGHTHGGQIWPFTLLTDLVYSLHHGLYRVGEGYHVVTCGIGWWGPPMRLGAPPEVWRIRLVAPDVPASVDGVPAEDLTPEA